MIIIKDMADIIYELSEYMEDGDVQYICNEAEIIDTYLQELVQMHDKVNENVPKSLYDLCDSFDVLLKKENISSFKAVKENFKYYNSDIKESIGKNPKREEMNDSSIQTIESYDEVMDTINDISIDSSDYKLEDVG